MENRGKRQASSIFGGMGFYIALLVCVLAAGVVGYFALLNNNTAIPEDDIVQPVDQTDPGPSQSVGASDREPAQEVLAEEPVVVQRPTVTPDTGVRSDPEAPGSDESALAPAPEDVPAQEPVEVVSPLAGETVAVFSVDQLAYDATLGDWRTHDGVDIKAPAGSAVAAAAPGTVLSVEEDRRLGTTVVVDHHDGYVTTYASLQPDPIVLAGDEVTAGMVIGTVGNTSLNEAALGAHLHFGVTKDGQAVDPAAFLGQ